MLILYLLLAHLSQGAQVRFTNPTSSAVVRFFVICRWSCTNFSHFQHLLCKYWANLYFCHGIHVSALRPTGLFYVYSILLNFMALDVISTCNVIILLSYFLCMYKQLMKHISLLCIFKVPHPISKLFKIDQNTFKLDVFNIQYNICAQTSIVN